MTTLKSANSMPATTLELILQLPLCYHLSCITGPILVDSLACRSCVQQGYFQDRYLQFFVKRRARRAPLINRGGTNYQYLVSLQLNVSICLGVDLCPLPWYIHCICSALQYLVQGTTRGTQLFSSSYTPFLKLGVSRLDKSRYSLLVRVLIQPGSTFRYRNSPSSQSRCMIAGKLLSTHVGLGEMRSPTAAPQAQASACLRA